jgi:hypothetical protein
MTRAPRAPGELVHVDVKKIGRRGRTCVGAVCGSCAFKWDRAVWSLAEVLSAALTADTCRDDGIRVANNRIVLNGFQIFVRSGGRYATQLRGLTFAAGVTRGQITGVINPSNITTPRSGSMTAPAFVRVDDGGPVLYSVG